jgi:hypothetical protein
MTPSLTVVAVPVLAEEFARQVSEAELWALRVVAWPIAGRPIEGPRIAGQPIVGLPIVAGIILIAERRSVPQQ